MHRLERIAVSLAIAGSLAAGGLAAAAPAQAVDPIPGMPGCYTFSWYDIQYFWDGTAGYCLDDGVTYFDFDGNYWRGGHRPAV